MNKSISTYKRYKFETGFYIFGVFWRFKSVLRDIKYEKIIVPTTEKVNTTQ